jgi:RimJ/RimL family protein N-acetyltransferase
MKQLACGNDELIVGWTLNEFGIEPKKVDLAIGVMEKDRMVASAFFQCHSGSDVELSYYGPKTMTLDVVKGLARIAVDHFGVSRVTVRSSPENEAMAHIEKIGFVREGICHHHYGFGQDAVIYGLFGRKLAKLAGKVMQ